MYKTDTKTNRQPRIYNNINTERHIDGQDRHKDRQTWR